MTALALSGWIVPTLRATRWVPLSGLAACLVAVTALAAYTGTWPTGQRGIVAAALASAVVAGLHDPAAALLAAVPTSVARRRARRLALLVPVAAAIWLSYVGLGHAWQPDSGWHLGPVVALTATGLAVEAWAATGRALEAGVAAPVVWYVVSWAGSGLNSDLTELLLAWEQHSFLVTSAAVAALVVAHQRGRDR